MTRERVPGSTHESESQYTMANRIGREQTERRVIPMVYSEALMPGETADFSKFHPVAGWESANELEDETGPNTPNKPVPQPRCIGGHPPDVYCDLCCPNIPGSHRHHLPSHCTDPDGCEHCGRGTISGSHCRGCLEVLQRVYPPHTVSQATSDADRFEEQLKDLDPREFAMPGGRDVVGTFNIGQVPGADAEPPNGVTFDEVVTDELRDDQGAHYSSGKPPLALIPRSGTRALAEVFAFGATKYAMHNWRKGILWSELLNSAKRHLDDFIDGEDNDRESGITHLAHAAWNCFAVIEYLTTHTELDDRYYPGAIVFEDNYNGLAEEETEPEPGTLAAMARDIPRDICDAVTASIIHGAAPYAAMHPEEPESIDLDELSRDDLYKIIQDQAAELWSHLIAKEEV